MAVKKKQKNISLKAQKNYWRTRPTKANNEEPDFINHHTNYNRATVSVTQKQACQLLPVHISRGNGFQSTKFQADRILWHSPCLNEAGKVPVVSPLATTTPDRQLNFTPVKKDNTGQKNVPCFVSGFGRSSHSHQNVLWVTSSRHNYGRHKDLQFIIINKSAYLNYTHSVIYCKKKNIYIFQVDLVHTGE